ncbi:MAG: DUF1016 N-terminal domain-containing protein [Candidatus Competibacteraceae bacterium]|nr:DUF1016 N-terminal domain-containing protein [Candidatus Competibacteraceae bacterium]
MRSRPASGRAVYQALRAANKELLSLYWDIGESIHRSRRPSAGVSVVETLARDLQFEFPGQRGFSARNLWNMRDFYMEDCGSQKPQPLVAESVGKSPSDHVGV